MKGEFIKYSGKISLIWPPKPLFNQKSNKNQSISSLFTEFCNFLTIWISDLPKYDFSLSSKEGSLHLIQREIQQKFDQQRNVWISDKYRKSLFIKKVKSIFTTLQEEPCDPSTGLNSIIYENMWFYDLEGYQDPMGYFLFRWAECEISLNNGAGSYFYDYSFKLILDYLYKIKVQSVIIEGGEKLIMSFVNQNMWDEARVFVGNKIFNNGVNAPKVNANYLSTEVNIFDSKLFVYRKIKN